MNVRRRRAVAPAVALAVPVLLATALVTAGPSPASATTTSAPGAPTGVHAIGYVNSARVGWFDPADDGGATITSWIVSSGGSSWTVTDDPALITGLPNGVARTFTVRAVNADGTGPASAPSNSVTPHAPFAGPSWAATGALHHARSGARAVRLGGGRVLVVGGAVMDTATWTSTALASAERYNPSTGTWAATGSLPSGREGFTLTLLSSGKVLLAGGTRTGPPLASVFLYDPGPGTWTATGSMTRPRYGHTATLLPSGKVLVTGGWTTAGGTGTTTATAELYDPASGHWTATAAMGSARKNHMATALRGGNVLVAGGDAGGDGTAAAEVYHPSTGSWSATGSMTAVRSIEEAGTPTMTLLPGGMVLVAGGYGPAAGVLATAERYNPATGTWAATGMMKTAIEGGHTATVLPSGKVLVAGGLDDFGGLAVAQTYDPSSGTWTRVNDLRHDRAWQTATLLGDGSVLLAGGTGWQPFQTLASSERYGP